MIGTIFSRHTEPVPVPALTPEIDAPTCPACLNPFGEAFDEQQCGACGKHRSCCSGDEFVNAGYHAYSKPTAFRG
jgi:hypothetical protein